MIENNYIELGKRAAACKVWRWMPGMADCWGGRVREGDGLDRNTAFPDLRDPATMGCLLALVRGAWAMPTGIIVRYSDDKGKWEVSWSGSTHGGICGSGATEAEALVMALESA